MTTEAKLVAALLDGRGGPMKLADLAYALALPRRDVEAACQELALAGWPLVSDGEGMALSDDPRAVRAAADALGRRLATQYRRVRSLRRTAARMAQPATLWDSVA